MQVTDTESFIKKAKLVHGDKYDYGKAIYTRGMDNIIIICASHGEFYQRASGHIKGQGCNKCAIERRKQQRKQVRIFDTDSYIEEAKIIHGDKFDYSKTKFTRLKDKIEIICNIHGSFMQTANSHIRGSGCRNCANKDKGSYHKISEFDFVERSNEVHDCFYSYEKAKYKSFHSKIQITCPYHGDFFQKPSHHLAGHGCDLCAREKNQGGYRYDNIGWRDPNMDCILYHVKISIDGEEDFHKFGVTTKTISERFKEIIAHGFKVEIVRECKDTLKNCLFMEKMIMDTMIKSGRAFKVRTLKNHGHSGWSECFRM